MASPYDQAPTLPPLRDIQGKARGTLVHVCATIVRLFDATAPAEGAEHQQLWIDDLTGIGSDFSYAADVFVAIRITEGGIGATIPFVTDTTAEFQGMFIPADAATPGTNDPGLAVLHFTHAPDGFVVYGGKTYR